MKNILVVVFSVLLFVSCNNNGSKIQIQMQQVGGVYQVPCKVNGVPMNFIFDTGASNVCISLTEALYLYKNGHITSSDLGNTAYSTVADGSIVENTHLKLRTLEVGGVEITNVDAIVMSTLNAPLLLGQSAIQKLGTIEMDGSILTLYPNGGVSDNSKINKKNGIIIQLQDWINGGWHYEGKIKALKWGNFSKEIKLYTKAINGTLVYRVKDENGVKHLVKLNDYFGLDEKDSHYAHKYRTEDYSYYFNMPGADVKGELAMIKAKQWQLLRGIYVYTNYNDWHYANLYWRNYDQKFMIVPCKKNAKWLYKNSIRYYEEPFNRREIFIIEDEHRFASYNYSLGHTVYRSFTHRAAEFSLNINE